MPPRCDAMIVVGGQGELQYQTLAIYDVQALCPQVIWIGRAAELEPSDTAGEGFYWNHCGRVHAWVDYKGGL